MSSYVTDLGGTHAVAVDLGGLPVTEVTPVVAGPEGETGPTGGTVFEYVMPVPGTTALIEHDLGRDPVAVQMLVDGSEVDEYGVTFPVPGHTVLVGWDTPALAVIRLL